MDICDRPTAPQSRWQNGHTERLMVRREYLDHVVVSHMRCQLLSYNALLQWRADTSVSEQGCAPVPGAVQVVGGMLATPILGGVHHQYIRT